jgi:hypothetical protein
VGFLVAWVDARFFSQRKILLGTVRASNQYAPRFSHTKIYAGFCEEFEAQGGARLVPQFSHMKN